MRKLNFKTLDEILKWGRLHTYHWFWGVIAIKSEYEDDKSTVSISEMLIDFERKNHLEDFCQEVQVYRKRNSVVHFFMWLFNYNDLAKKNIVLNYYEQREKVKSEMKSSDIGASSSLLESKSLQIVSRENIAGSGLEQSRSTFNFFEQMRNFLALCWGREGDDAATNVFISASVKKSSQRLVYNEQQIEDLNVFGINCTIGDSYCSIIQADRWKKIVVTSHPDKGGSAEEFRRVHDAHSRLRKSSRDQEKFNHNDYYNVFLARIKSREPQILREIYTEGLGVVESKPKSEWQVALKSVIRAKAENYRVDRVREFVEYIHQISSCISKEDKDSMLHREATASKLQYDLVVRDFTHELQVGGLIERIIDDGDTQRLKAEAAVMLGEIRAERKELNDISIAVAKNHEVTLSLAEDFRVLKNDFAEIRVEADDYIERCNVYEKRTDDLVDLNAKNRAEIFRQGEYLKKLKADFEKLEHLIKTQPRKQGGLFAAQQEASGNSSFETKSPETARLFKP